MVGHGFAAQRPELLEQEGGGHDGGPRVKGIPTPSVNVGAAPDIV